MRLWRLTKPEHAPGLDGEGARLWGGRWNSPGLPAVYCAGSLALATLEVLVHLPPAMRRAGAMPPYLAIGLDVPDSALTDPGLADDLSDDACREIGDDWLRRGESLGLVVPSRVILLERNVMLNPAHPGMAQTRVALTRPFRFDPRLTAPR